MRVTAPLGFPVLGRVAHLFHGVPWRSQTALCGRQLRFVALWERREPAVCERCAGIARRMAGGLW